MQVKQVPTGFQVLMGCVIVSHEVAKEDFQLLGLVKIPMVEEMQQVLLQVLLVTDV